MDAYLTSIISRIIDARRSERVNDYTKTIADTNSSININEIVQSINAAYHHDWEKQKLEFARSFLARTWGGIPLPVLSLCGRGTQEIRYTKYLAFFLDGTKAHGLGTRLLDELLNFVANNKNKIDTYQSIVENEKWIGQTGDKEDVVNCYCDIVISCDNHVIFLEQKILSGESINPRSTTTQLIRYDNAIKDNIEFLNKEKIRIFLTPSGKRSEKSPGWFPLSYNDLVRTGMKVLYNGGLSSIARENLKRFLLDILLGPFDKTESEIQELVELAEKAVMKPNFGDRLRFDRLVSRNNMLVKLIMEG